MNRTASSPFVAGLLLCVLAAAARAGTISEIAAGALIGPQVIDFESSANGSIAGNDAVFTSAFISNVSATGSPGGDTYSSFAPSTRGLFVQGGSQLVLATLGSGTAIDNNGVFTIDLSGTATQFGFEVLDQANDTYTVSYFNGVTAVGSNAFTYGSTNVVRYFSNTEAFNRVVISAAGGGGYGLDNLTVGNFVSAIATPEPGTASLFALGACVAAAVARRQRRARTRRPTAT